MFCLAKNEVVSTHHLDESELHELFDLKTQLTYNLTEKNHSI